MAEAVQRVIVKAYASLLTPHHQRPLVAEDVLAHQHLRPQGAAPCRARSERSATHVAQTSAPPGRLGATTLRAARTRASAAGRAAMIPSTHSSSSVAYVASSSPASARAAWTCASVRSSTDPVALVVRSSVLSCRTTS
jgi:hypothetical protein